MGMSDFVKKMMFAKQLDFQEGQFEMLGVRGVLLPAFTLTRVWEELYKERGDGLFDVMFSVGKQHGEFAISRMGEEHHISKRRFVSETLDSANVMGMGRMEAIEFNPDKEVIRMTVEDSPFVDEFTESDVLQEIDEPIHHVIRGMLVAIGEELFGDEVDAEETECEYTGDERCLITVRGMTDD